MNLQLIHDDTNPPTREHIIKNGATVYLEKRTPTSKVYQHSFHKQTIKVTDIDVQMEAIEKAFDNGFDIVKVEYAKRTS